MRRNLSSETIKKHLSPGLVYRRVDLSGLSTNIDRNLVALVREGALVKIQQGLYSCPKKTDFGTAPADEAALLGSFLKYDRYVVYSYSQFNLLGLGTTQLYNKRVVFNRKRHGEIVLDGRTYHFYRWREVPAALSREFLLVELVNHISEIAEDRAGILASIQAKAHEFDMPGLKRSVKRFGTYSTQLIFKQIIDKKNDVK